MKTTITDRHGNIEQELSYDPWGTRRNPDTWHTHNNQNLEAPMFDRGYTGHEHLYAFGLINMNGRVYDPQTSSFLSVDAYVQSPEDAQSFNRYAYCHNNPLRYVDPSGWYMLGAGHGTSFNNNPGWGESYSQHAYEWREICNAGARDAVADALLTLYKCGGGGGSIVSGTLVIGEDGRIEDIKCYFSYHFDNNQLNYAGINKNTKGKCVVTALGSTRRIWFASTKKYADGTQQWIEKAKEYEKAKNRSFNRYGNIVDFIQWNNEEGAYASYEADFIESSEIEDALDDKYIVAVCVGLKNEKDIIENCGQSGHFGNLKGFIGYTDGSFTFIFSEPEGTRFLDTFTTKSLINLETPAKYTYMKFIKYKFIP